VRTLEELYDAPAARILAALEGVEDEVSCALVVGHNPGIGELAVALSAGSGKAGDALRRGLPAGALAAFELEITAWAELGAARGRLVAFDAP
jgi:phosphohistidine phosphatase